VDGAEVLLLAIVADMEGLLADTASEAQERGLSGLDSASMQVVSPSKANRQVPREYDEEMEKIRHRIENFFATRKQCRGIATRDDKRASTFLGAIHLAAVIWLNGPHALETSTAPHIVSSRSGGCSLHTSGAEYPP
jgi:hypothetical protein